MGARPATAQTNHLLSSECQSFSQTSNIRLPHFLKMSTISYNHDSSSPLNKSNPTPLKVKATQSHCSVCRTLISGMKCVEKTGAEIRLRAYVSPLIRLWNWKPLVWCVRWWSYDTHSGFTSSLRQPHGVAAQLKSLSRLSTSCFFSTINPPPPRQSSRRQIAVCAAGSAVLMKAQKKIREERTGGWEKSNGRRICLSQRLARWRLLDQSLQTGCWFDSSPLSSHDLLSVAFVSKMQQIWRLWSPQGWLR